MLIVFDSVFEMASFCQKDFEHCHLSSQKSTNLLFVVSFYSLWQNTDFDDEHKYGKNIADNNDKQNSVR